MNEFKELVDLMSYMRSEKGCPGDREQTIESFLEHFTEESAELLEAIEKKDYENLKEELGDILWHVLFISQIAKEEGRFDINDVMSEVKDKMIRRHPHVFGDSKAETTEEVIEQYNKVKAQEKLSSKILEDKESNDKQK